MSRAHCETQYASPSNRRLDRRDAETLNCLARSSPSGEEPELPGRQEQRAPQVRAAWQFRPGKVARRALGPLPALPAARVSLVAFEMWTEIYRAQPPKPVRTPPALPSKGRSQAINLGIP